MSPFHHFGVEEFGQLLRDRYPTFNVRIVDHEPGHWLEIKTNILYKPFIVAWPENVPQLMAAFDKKVLA